MGAALGLLRLQKVDSNINQVQARLEQIRQILENNAEIVTAQGRLDAAEQEQAQAEELRRSKHAEAASQRIKIQQAESSLYGGAVRNPKELQDLQADVQSLKKHLATIEELEFDAMVRLEAAQTDVGSAQAGLDEIGRRLQDEHRRLIAERTDLLRNLESLRDERSAALSEMDPGHLQTYERIAGLRRGVAVAEISDNACEACGTRLTAALQQSARHSSELVLCPSCGRILFGG